MVKKDPVCRQTGFTLIEVVLACTILAILISIMIAAIDPIKQANKGYDAQKRRDLNRIRTAFEEYYNDKRCYPSQAFVDTLVCKSAGFSPWLASWPCDPNGTSYKIVVENSVCSHWYAVLTRLDDDKSMLTKKYNYCVGTSNIDCYLYNEDK